MTQTYETGFKTTLSRALATGDTTMYVATAPTVTAGRVFLKNGNTKEWIKYTGVSGSTLTGLVRDLSQTADPSTVGTGLQWNAGTEVVLVAMHDQLVDKFQPLLYTAVTASGEGAFAITTTTNQTNATGSLLKIKQDHASSVGRTVHLVDDGVGDTVYIEKNNYGNMVNLVQAVNSASACIGAIIDIQNAGAGLEYAVRLNGSEVVASAVGGSQDKKIRISVAGTDYFIPLHTA